MRDQLHEADSPSLIEPPETCYIGADPFTGIARVVIITEVLLFGLWLILMVTPPTI